MGRITQQEWEVEEPGSSFPRGHTPDERGVSEHRPGSIPPEPGHSGGPGHTQDPLADPAGRASVLCWSRFNNVLATGETPGLQPFCEFLPCPNLGGSQATRQDEGPQSWGEAHTVGS